MAAQYPPAMPQLGSFYPSGHPPIMPPPPPHLFQPRMPYLPTPSMENMGGYSDIEDPNRTMPSPQPGSQRPRRRQQPGSEHVKHRRTRSGCYTCRQRRVKCDETRPVCERCRKGKRECNYPGTGSSTKPARRESKSKSSASSPSSPSGDEDGNDEKIPLSAIPDDDEDMDGDTTPTSASVESYKMSGLSNVNSNSPTNESSTAWSRPQRPQPSRSNSKHSIKFSIQQHPRWSTLSKDVKKYVLFHRDNLSYHHYAFKYDGSDFLKSTFLEIALNDSSQALLYAIVAFSCYHYVIAGGDRRMSLETFLQYYNRSIMYLQSALKKKKPSVPTLLTILQLATIEEFLGDWANLLGHERAAYQILTELFTPQTITQDETRRKIAAWYIRFDLFAGIMGGGETKLSREWFAACQEHYRRQSRDRPDDVPAKLEDLFSTSRLLATDSTLMFSAKKKEQISDEEFATKTRDLVQQYADFEHLLETAFSDSTNFIKSFPHAPPPSEDDITDYRDPNFLYNEELFTMNYVLLDFWAIDLNLKHQLTVAQQQTPTPEMTELALKKCKMIEAIERSGLGQKGALLGCQASLGIASLFLPKDQKHTDWARRKFAVIEQMGFVYPPTFRQHMSAVWGVDVTQWWLPNNEGYPNAIREVRDFIAYRARAPPSSPDTMDANVQDMSGIFRKLRFASGGSGAGYGTDSDQFSPDLGRTGMYESSPEQFWQS